MAPTVASASTHEHLLGQLLDHVEELVRQNEQESYELETMVRSAWKARKATGLQPWTLLRTHTRARRPCLVILGISNGEMSADVYMLDVEHKSFVRLLSHELINVMRGT